MAANKYISGSLTLNNSHDGQNVHMPCNTSISCKMCFEHGKMYYHKTKYYVEIRPSDDNDICRGYFTLDNNLHQRHSLTFYENEMTFNFFASEAYGPMLAHDGDTSTYQCRFVIHEDSKPLYAQLQKIMNSKPLTNDEIKKIENIVDTFIPNLQFTFNDVHKYNDYFQNGKLTNVLTNEFVAHFDDIIANIANNSCNDTNLLVRKYINEKTIFKTNLPGHNEISTLFTDFVVERLFINDDKQ